MTRKTPEIYQPN